MKYLMKYNESIKEIDFDKLVNDFKNLSNECLAYLVDDGFTISIRKDGNPFVGYYISFSLTIEKTIGNPDEGGRYISENFSWKDIKDDFIPYLQMVKEKFLIRDEYSLPFYIVTNYGNYTLSYDNGEKVANIDFYHLLR